MILEPPRSGKSEMASRRFPAWYLGRHPQRQIICASYNSDIAGDFGRDVRNIVSDPKFQALCDGVWGCRLAADSQAANRWHTDAGGVYVAAGVGAAITGRGAHVLLIDDPFKGREEADSEATRETVWDWYRAVAYTRLMPGGAIVLIVTRWHDDDLAGRLCVDMERGGDRWEIINLPARAEAGDALGREPGEPLWPEWYDDAALTRIQHTIGSRDWAALYQQRPNPETGSYFEEGWLRYYDERPKLTTLRTYGASDYAVTEDGGDYTVHGVIGVDPEDRIFVLDWWREQTKSDVWVETVIDLMKRWKPLAWGEEGGQIEKGVGPFLAKRMRERKVNCLRRQYASSRDKPTRARSIQARTSMGMLYLPRKAPWTEELVAELLRFPVGKHDDQVDVLSLFGRMLDRMIAGSEEPKPKEPVKLGPPTYDELMKLQPKDDPDAPRRI